jgi:hypothetical protein
MLDELRPTSAEIKFLTFAYNRFYNIYEEVMDDSFWQKDPWYRFTKIKDGFAIYSELLNYEPLTWVIDAIKIQRPPMEAEIAKDLFKFIRNLIVHFPFFDSWDEVMVNHSLVKWHKENQFIDKFIKKYKGKESVKYRFWEPNKKRMTYLSINFPANYEDDTNIVLKDILTEKEGVKFSFILMKQVINTQVEP